MRRATTGNSEASRIRHFETGEPWTPRHPNGSPAANATGPAPSRPGACGHSGNRTQVARRRGGQRPIELGCGTAYVSAWLARRGARPVGIDNSAKQLETARRLQREQARVSTDPRQRRIGALPRCQLRPGHLRVRRRDLGRPLRVGARGGSPPAAGRQARVHRQRLHHDALHARAGQRARRRPAGPRPVRAPPHRVADDARSSSTWPTANGSGCCAETTSRSRI